MTPSFINTTLEEMNKKLAGFQSATQDKHESIIKIEEMLEQNEFSFSGSYSFFL